MTFFATLLFGAGALLLVSALEKTSLTGTIAQVLKGDLSLHAPQQSPSSGGSSSSNGPNAPITGAPYNPTQPGYYPTF